MFVITNGRSEQVDELDTCQKKIALTNLMFSGLWVK